jgi:hypothetical protein
MPVENVARLLNADESLVKTGQGIGAVELTRNLAGGQHLDS